ncbi:MAG: amidase family protein [Pseudomonadales bacterium]|nr:amidase family protein [Pseudomonadales bacterium]
MTAAATREQARRLLSELLRKDTVLCFPTAPFPAPDRDIDGPAAAALWPAIAPLTCIAGLTGAPQLTVPLTRVGGRPVGLSLLGPPGSDGALVTTATWLFGSDP